MNPIFLPRIPRSIHGLCAFLLLTMMPTASSLRTHAAEERPTQPLSLHPENPRYFSYRDQPTILITSGEHYGALLNRDFDFETYFETLAADGFNLTRVFSGIYCEPEGAFKIARNTLAPAPGKFIAPYARSDVPGYANGGKKFDLHQWNRAYFERLHALLDSASRHGIIVEYHFFCPFYNDKMWDLSPFNPANHINPLPQPKQPNDIWSLEHSALYLGIQKAFVRKIVQELNRHPNLYYEICNEPYQKALPQDWHDAMAQLIVDTEKEYLHRHLISWNVANHGDGEKAIVHEPHPAYSIFNFHYSNPPHEVDRNWHLEKPIGDNETGFDGQENRPYRTEAWEFILAGGALFNHLDYSFAAAGHEDGTFAYPDHQPGGGNATLRKQFAALKKLVETCDIPALAPVPAKTVVASPLPKKSRLRVLTEKERVWLLYLTDTGPDHRVTFDLNLPHGDYTLSWMNPIDGKIARIDSLSHRGNDHLTLPSPELPEDLALKIVRTAE